ncbi:hypothetical protein BKA70DRAFT_569285 [Coprinopsis sp. MPI-PUGE-AT-0042]|nr:hypothetical protein BKA70DRAFT_569285 [Coprinopsis sp. MPI-PUGE-AT-0042]
MTHEISHIDAITGRPVPLNIVHANHAQLVVFIFMNMWTALLGLPLLLGIIVFSKRITRHGTLINLCAAFILTGIVSCLLVFSGKAAPSDPEPPPNLCLLQAAMIYGMPPLTATAAFMLVLQMWFKIRAAYLGQVYEDKDHRARLWIMIITPYVAYLIAVMATAVIGANDSSRVSRNRRVFYCSVDFLPLSNAITIFSATVLFATIVFEVWTIVFLVKHHSFMKAEGSNIRKTIDLSFSLRTILFGIYILACMSLSLLSVTSPASPAPDLVISTAGTVLILIFGTQTDILRVLCFWRDIPWGIFAFKKTIQVEQDYKGVDLKYAFDAESTHAQPYRPWRAPETFKPDGI